MSTKIITLENLRRENFSPKEFYYSETAIKHNIDNEPKELAELTCLLHLSHKLQALRNHVKRSITIHSAYRCRELNHKVGGSPNSFHIQGLAADITIKNISLEQIARELKYSNILFDKCLIEPKQGIVHVQFQLAEAKNRNYIGIAEKKNGVWRTQQLIID